MRVCVLNTETINAKNGLVWKKVHFVDVKRKLTGTLFLSSEDYTRLRVDEVKLLEDDVLEDNADVQFDQNKRVVEVTPLG